MPGAADWREWITFMGDLLGLGLADDRDRPLRQDLLKGQNAASHFAVIPDLDQARCNGLALHAGVATVVC
jgi:hypothetical protein